MKFPDATDPPEADGGVASNKRKTRAALQQRARFLAALGGEGRLRRPARQRTEDAKKLTVEPCGVEELERWARGRRSAHPLIPCERANSASFGRSSVTAFQTTSQSVRW